MLRRAAPLCYIPGGQITWGIRCSDAWPSSGLVTRVLAPAVPRGTQVRERCARQ